MKKMVLDKLRVTVDLALAVTFLSFFLTNVVSACTCVELLKSTVEQGINQSDVVFIGKVISVKGKQEQRILSYIEGLRVFLPLADSAPKKIVTFEVVKLYKGIKRTDTLEVETGAINGGCGYPFEVSKTYIVYAKYEANKHIEDKMVIAVTTDICTRTKIFDSGEAAEIAQLMEKKNEK